MTDEFNPDVVPGSEDSPLTVVEETAPVVGETPLKKAELIEAVATASGLRKSDAKAAVETTLAAMGAALGAGREMNLPPFGKLAINRTKVKANGTVTIARIRQPRAMPKPNDPLAQPDEGR